MRLCRFSAHLRLWWGKFTDAVPDDSQSLNLSAADSRRLKHLNTFHRFSDDFCIQLLYVRVLAYKSNKAVREMITHKTPRMQQRSLFYSGCGILFSKSCTDQRNKHP